MWSEPLTAQAQDDGRSVAVITVYDGHGAPVAQVRCDYSAAARTGLFGDMIITAPGGAPRQRIRALVLLVREALRTAANKGLTHVRTEPPARLLPFAERMSNLRGRRTHHDPDPANARYELAGDLAHVRTHALDTTDLDGNPRAVVSSAAVGEEAGGEGHAHGNVA